MENAIVDANATQCMGWWELHIDTIRPIRERNPKLKTVSGKTNAQFTTLNYKKRTLHFSKI